MADFRRNFISRLVLLALLPYVIFAFGAQFLHACAQLNRQDCHTSLTRSAGTLHDAASVSPAVSSSEDTCASCQWTHSISSGPQIAYTVALTSTVTPVTDALVTDYHHSPTIHISPRAPPTI